MKWMQFLLMAVVSMAGVGCEEHISEKVKYKINEPVFMSLQEFRNSVQVHAGEYELTGHGKIAFYKDYLYLSDPGQGVYIINNEDPSNPLVTGYIELLGNSDVTVRNDLLYADSFIDLVWFDVHNPENPVLKGRLEKVFPEAMPEIENGLGFDYQLCVGDQRQDSVIVGWKEVERTEMVHVYEGNAKFWRWGWLRGDLVNLSEKLYDAGSSNSINGSMSRFSLYKDHLYVVINNYMQVFDVSGPTPDRVVENYPVGWNVETIFNYKDYLYMGTPTGLLIYSVENPLQPVYLSSVRHVLGCDPVVVEEDIAYVTVRSGNECGQDNNELIIIDVQDPAHPVQLISYDMFHPGGLSIDNNILYVCDEGLKILDAADPYTLMEHTLAHYDDMHGYDVIAADNLLMMIAQEGIYQYDYQDVENVVFLSLLPIVAENQ